MDKHVCGCNEYFSGNVHLCHKHTLNIFNTESIQDVIKIVLKPINFVNYHDKFVLTCCVKYKNDNNECIIIKVTSIDETTVVQLRLCDNNLYSGCIIYDSIYRYRIDNNIIRWKEEMIPTLDPIKKHLRNLVIYV